MCAPNDKMPVHITVLDGKTVKTTWAADRTQAKRAEELFRYDGAGKTRVFNNGGIEKYRIVGWWS